MLVLAGALMSLQSGAETPGGTEATNAAPPIRLPVVKRAAAVQPVVGDPKDAHLDKTPPRETKGLDLVKMGWTYNCMECHKLFPARWHFEFGFNEHKNIQLAHGNNRFCLNCHHPGNRNAFVDYDGSEIAQSDVVLLCAKCHGPTYRDWQAGVHGRVNGHWDTEKGLRTKLRCIQCHDPHSPAFKSMKPLPPLKYPARAAHGRPAGHATERARAGAQQGPNGMQPADKSANSTRAHVAASDHARAGGAEDGAAAEDGRAPGMRAPRQ